MLACLDFKRADEELTTEKVKRKSKKKAGKTLQLLEIELVEGSVLKEEKVKVKIQERREEAAEKLLKTKKARIWKIWLHIWLWKITEN